MENLQLQVNQNNNFKFVSLKLTQVERETEIEEFNKSVMVCSHPLVNAVNYKVENYCYDDKMAICEFWDDYGDMPKYTLGFKFPNDSIYFHNTDYIITYDIGQSSFSFINQTPPFSEK